MPRPTSLVVKNGSKTRSAISSGMPHAGVGDRDDARRRRRARARTAIVPRSPRVADDALDRVRGVDDEVQEDLVELAAVADDRRAASSKSVSTSAMYLYAFVATISVSCSVATTSSGAFSTVGGCAKSRIARTIVATRETPSAPRSNAAGTRSRRYSRSAISSASRTRSSSAGSTVPGLGGVAQLLVERREREQVGERVLEEADRVADELDRRVDLVRDAGGELADGLELLREPQLVLHRARVRASARLAS